jgi:hypothetical protein
VPITTHFCALWAEVGASITDVQKSLGLEHLHLVVIQPTRSRQVLRTDHAIRAAPATLSPNIRGNDEGDKRERVIRTGRKQKTSLSRWIPAIKFSTSMTPVYIIWLIIKFGQAARVV